MGILEKIRTADEQENIFSPPPRSKPKPEENILPTGGGSPATPCPRCVAPYGLHFWKDPYGEWHCTQCEPPAVLAQVREQRIVSRDGTLVTEYVLAEDGTFTAGEDFPEYARGRWRYYEDRYGHHFERLGVKHN